MSGYWGTSELATTDVLVVFNNWFKLSAPNLVIGICSQSSSGFRGGIVHHLGPSCSQYPMQLCTDIRGPQRKNCTFLDSLTLAPPWDWYFKVLTEIPAHLFNRLPRGLFKIFRIPRGWIIMTLLTLWPFCCRHMYCHVQTFQMFPLQWTVITVDRLAFPLSPLSEQNCDLSNMGLGRSTCKTKNIPIGLSCTLSFVLANVSMLTHERT